MLSADSYREPVILFLKAQGKKIKDQPGMVLYGNPPRWHKFDPGKHTDASQTHYHAKKTLEIKAAKQIASKGSHGHDGASPEDHIAKMKALAKEHQAKASASAAVTGWKKAMMAGKAPTKSQHDAMVALMATNREKAKKIAAEVVAAIGAEKYQALFDQVEGNAPKAPVASAKAKAEAKATEAKPAAKPKADSKPAAPEAAKNLKPPAISPGLEKDLISWVADGKPDNAGALADIYDSLTPAQQEYLAEKATEHPSLGGWKSALLAGKSPTPEQHEAKMLHLQTDHEAVMDATKAVVEAIGPEKYMELIAQHHPEVQKAQALGAIDWDSYLLPDSNTNAKSHNAKVKKIKEAAYKGDVAALQAMKFGLNTYGKKQAKLTKQAIRVLGGLVSAKAAPASAEAKAPTADTQALGAIDWDSYLLPDSNTNAKSHNAKVKKIKEAAYKGDVAALQAMKFGLNTYGKKQAKLTKQAIRALGGLVSAKAAPASAEAKAPTADTQALSAPTLQNPKEGDVKTVNGHQYQLINGRWHRVDKDQNTAKQAGSAQQNAIPTVGKPAAPALSQDELIDGWSKAVKSGKAPTKEQADAPAIMFINPAGVAASTAGTAMSIDDWTEHPGTQKGSNPGGLYTDKSGQQWYVKFPKSEDHVKNELLAAKLYQAAGVAVPELQVIIRDGKIGIASKWIDGLSKAGSDIKHADGALEGFAVDAWLGNYDSVGTGYDNLLKDANGKAVRIDVGGSLIFRAKGANKTDFDNKVKELQTMLDPGKNIYAATVFGGITPEQIEAGVAKVAAISEAQIKQMVYQFGPGDDAAKAKLAKKLIARRKDLLKQYPEVAKKSAKPTPKFDPSKLSEPPNFLSWGDTGKPGPSSVQAINETNQKATQAIFAAAKTGDIEAVKAVKGDIVDKVTGQKTGEVNVLMHPSQYISGYAKQMINEIDAQLNPPKPFKWRSNYSLAKIDSGVPIEKNVATTALKKIGYFVVLSRPGLVSGVKDLLDVEKITYKNGKVSESTYSPVMEKIYPKIPKTQRQALKFYTGRGYKSINRSLRSGNPSGAAKSAQQAVHTHGHEIKAGTVLSRKLSLYDEDLKLFLNSAGSVLQEPAIISTSISPNVWGGNIHLKMHVGPGVKGMYVGYDSAPNGESISVNAGEKEILLPPNTRVYVVSVKEAPSYGDEDDFGVGTEYIAECIILPTQE